MSDLSREETERLAFKFWIELTPQIQMVGLEGKKHAIDGMADLLQRTVNVKCVEARVKEAVWWEHLAGNDHAEAEAFKESCMYCRRIAQLQRELAEARKGEQRDEK
jgi:hypothetical protein